VVQYTGRYGTAQMTIPKIAFVPLKSTPPLAAGWGGGGGREAAKGSLYSRDRFGVFDDYRRHLVGIMVALHTCRVCWNTGTIVLDVL
jgi:hypothetical protein